MYMFLLICVNISFSWKFLLFLLYLCSGVAPVWWHNLQLAQLVWKSTQHNANSKEHGSCWRKDHCDSGIAASLERVPSGWRRYKFDCLGCNRSYEEFGLLYDANTGRGIWCLQKECSIIFQLWKSRSLLYQFLSSFYWLVRSKGEHKIMLEFFPLMPLILESVSYVIESVIC